MSINKTREELVKMYVDSLKEGNIPWRQRWVSSLNINGLTHQEYRGVNQLLLSFVTYKEKYNDNRWMTYKQIIDKGYKLKEAKGKGVPVEFWSAYDIKNKQKISISDYENIIRNKPEIKDDYKLFCNTSYVFNGSLIEGLPQKDMYPYDKDIPSNVFIQRVIKGLGVKYKEEGSRAYYSPQDDLVVIPPSTKFYDKYSYYATQLHELCHATGHPKRMNRDQSNKNKKDYAREELVAEISSSFLMGKLEIEPAELDYNNHKAYIQSWISILEDKPQELFKAINESNKVCEFIDYKLRVKENER